MAVTTALDLGRERAVDDRLGQVDAALGHADEVDRLGGGHGHLEGGRVGHADVFRGEDDDPAGDEARVLPRLDHAGQVVEGGVGVGAAHALDEGADDVVVLVALAVVADGGLVDGLLHHLDGDVVGQQGGGLQVGQRAPGVSPASRTSCSFASGCRTAAPLRPRSSVTARSRTAATSSSVSDSRVSSSERDSSGEMTEKNGFSRGRADEGDPAVLHGREQRVLLGLVEAVDLVDEQDGLPPGHAQLAAGALDGRTDVLDPGRDGRDLDEPALGHVGDDVGQRGLAGARRPPQEQRHGGLALDQPPQGVPEPSRWRCPITSSRVRGRIRTASGSGVLSRAAESNRLSTNP